MDKIEDIKVKTFVGDLIPRAYQKARFEIFYPDEIDYGDGIYGESVKYKGYIMDLGTSGVAGHGYYSKDEPLHLNYLVIKDEDGDYRILDEISRLNNDYTRESLWNLRTIGKVVVNKNWKPRKKCGCI